MGTGHYLVFDVGGTDVKAGLADAGGQLHHVRRQPTAIAAPGQDPAAVLIEQLATLAGTLRQAAHEPPRAMGLAVCGLVDAPAGIGRYSANLGWVDAPLRQMAQDALGLPVGFGHDVATAARAELELGAGAQDPQLRRNSALLIIGTGIASTLVVEGQVVSSEGYAGELGHAQVPGGLPCKCGATGCLETIASAGAIARLYSQQAGAVPGAEQVFAARAAGDRIAGQVIEQAIEALSFTLAQLCATTAPSGIVIGGGLAQAGPPFFAELGQALERRLSFHRRPRLVPAALGADAGLQGAWLLARQTTTTGGTP
ncbi:Sugar kinase [Glutamicibacter creatinolyticus]|uniref:Sugar kinase n=2 Tax=Glutamicibacter creatinolyticus TaxID=162496 RepID=A0A5B7WTA0_9MICC|nr:ROK family protein [Glutamicibacter creatinolyticus]QCY46465.1 Sugar kinase [Glutamicibacter creatinolyticus]